MSVMPSRRESPCADCPPVRENVAETRPGLAGKPEPRPHTVSDAGQSQDHSFIECAPFPLYPKWRVYEELQSADSVFHNRTNRTVRCSQAHPQVFGAWLSETRKLPFLLCPCIRNLLRLPASMSYDPNLLLLDYKEVFIEGIRCMHNTCVTCDFPGGELAWVPECTYCGVQFPEPVLLETPEPAKEEVVEFKPGSVNAGNPATYLTEVAEGTGTLTVVPESVLEPEPEETDAIGLHCCLSECDCPVGELARGPECPDCEAQFLKLRLPQPTELSEEEEDTDAETDYSSSENEIDCQGLHPNVYVPWQTPGIDVLALMCPCLREAYDKGVDMSQVPLDFKTTEVDGEPCIQCFSPTCDCSRGALAWEPECDCCGACFLKPIIPQPAEPAEKEMPDVSTLPAQATASPPTSAVEIVEGPCVQMDILDSGPEPEPLKAESQMLEPQMLVPDPVPEQEPQSPEPQIPESQGKVSMPPSSFGDSSDQQLGVMRLPADHSCQVTEPTILADTEPAVGPYALLWPVRPSTMVSAVPGLGSVPANDDRGELTAPEVSGVGSPVIVEPGGSKGRVTRAMGSPRHRVLVELSPPEDLCRPGSGFDIIKVSGTAAISDAYSCASNLQAFSSHNTGLHEDIVLSTEDVTVKGIAGADKDCAETALLVVASSMRTMERLVRHVVDRGKRLNLPFSRKTKPEDPARVNTQDPLLFFLRGGGDGLAVETVTPDLEFQKTHRSQGGIPSPNQLGALHFETQIASGIHVMGKCKLCAV
ncbi:uncharacterized protein LOC142493186 [Ascaphus truei]|uniref:uncharacterized protein LOC142493186 n=1 Tax=Ascaphus truei TaxID=8439 RepID=UPI003F592186